MQICNGDYANIYKHENADADAIAELKSKPSYRA